MQKGSKKLVSYDVIVAATKGEDAAILEVLEHYTPYILKLSMELKRTKDGELYYELNEDWQSDLQMKLLEVLKKFRPV